MKPLFPITFLLLAMTGLYTPVHAQTQNPDTTKEPIYTRVEIEASFPGGQAAWANYLKKNLRYPAVEEQNGIQGTVIVDFIVDKQGNVSYIHAVDGPEDAGLRKEAERLVRNSRLWTPAILDGKQVWSHRKIPIEFKLPVE